MPVFTEVANAYRDLRILPSRAPALPKLKAPSTSPPGNFEVVVIGAGPSGLLLTLLLARYGIESLVCFDAKPGTLKAGQADGLQPRTLEVLKSLGIADEILQDGCHMSEVAFWNPVPVSCTNGNGVVETPGIERTAFVPDVNVAARYKHEVTIHQGRIERILKENLDQYADENTLRFSHRFIGFEFQEADNPEFPIVVKVESTGSDGSIVENTYRTKYLVGADGAHSAVRQNMGLKLEGETTDHIWGVVDFVADTDFPDIRKRCAIHSSTGSVMVIPRERIATGEYLTRLYVQVADDINLDSACENSAAVKDLRQKRAAITLEYILNQATRVFAPYKIDIKNGTTVDWWAAYQIGQRMTPKSSASDRDGVDRVFIVGDACHTHSPKAGQGMNVSMMDSYNLSWKLAHTLRNLIPPTTNSNKNAILKTFEYERLNVARQLIAFDSKFSSMFSGQIGGEDSSVKALTHDEFVSVFREGSGFTSGCGIEYGDSVLVKHIMDRNSSPVTGSDPLSGTLHAGRRLLDVKVRRYADANLRHLQDDFPSTGRYRILVLASDDLLNPSGVSAVALTKICNIISQFPSSMVELIVLHPLKERFEWTDLPPALKKYCEMRFYGCADNAYQVYGVPETSGALVTVRPDGVVGMIDHLEAYEAVQSYLEGSLVMHS